VAEAGAIGEAFTRLARQTGFESRPDQVHLARLIADMMAGERTAAMEAPTGLGKSLAALVPALLFAQSGKRVVLATYTNVLAEQYWRKDLPQAQSLVEGEVKVGFLIGRSRYVCRLALAEKSETHEAGFEAFADQGTDSEYRRYGAKVKARHLPTWSEVAVPPVCAGRYCPFYRDCYFYSARREALESKLVITNHSVVITDALFRQRPDLGAEEEAGLLGPYDYLIIDEAHDFSTAAVGGLEIEIGPARIDGLLGLARRIGEAVEGIPLDPDVRREFTQARGELVARLAPLRDEMQQGPRVEGIVVVRPAELREDPVVAEAVHSEADNLARRWLDEISDALREFVPAYENLLGALSEAGAGYRSVLEPVRNYGMFFRETAWAAENFDSPETSSVAFLAGEAEGVKMRQDKLDLAEVLPNLLWNKRPTTFLSATLVLDGEFDYFAETLGVEPDYQEILPSPYDFGRQAAAYLPPIGRIPDPGEARRHQREPEYFAALAFELRSIITLMGGRTLALFHSRREMEAVHALLQLDDSLPVLVQPKTSPGPVGDRFRAEPRTSLFALRSFWTGFDAPGETCQCVAIVRIPFEVPTEPRARARMAYQRRQGRDPFFASTLPSAKMLVRQGAGRLIRARTDRGVIALLDPRLRTKRYGEQIVANLPPELNVFSEFADAAGSVGLGQEPDWFDLGR
jgi:ATP-dependent DNA helicase DinG